MEATVASFVSVLIVSLASLVGIAAFSLQEERLRRILYILVGLAAGALIGDAAIHLIPEALSEIEDARTFSFLLILGIVVFFILEKYLRWHHAHHGLEEEHESEEVDHHPRHLAPLVLFADGVHNMVDGAVIAASYLVSFPVGVATTIAVFLHEIPQEVADYALLTHSGLSRGKALFFNFLSALIAFLGVILVLMFSNVVDSIGPLAAAFTAGAFIYIAATDLIPELHKTKDPKRSATELSAFVVGIVLMFALSFLEF